MTQKDHDTTVIHTGSDGSGGAAWFVIGAAVVVALIAGYLFFDGDPGGNAAPAGSAAPSGGDAAAEGGAAVDAN